MDKRRHKKILIIKPSSLGDIVHSLPTLKAVRQLFPKAFISWLVKEEWAGILAGNPYLDEILSFPFTLKGMPQIIGSVRKRKFDLVLDLQGLLRSSVISFLSGASIRIGYDSAREGAKIFYTERVRVPLLDIHAVDRYMLSVGIEGFAPSPPDFYIKIDQADTGYVREMLTGDLPASRPLIAVNPLARWETKVWPQERFISLTDHLINMLEARIVLIGRHEEERDGEVASSSFPGSIIDMRGKTSLTQLAALLKEVDLLVTNDSGPMHIAAALGTPVVAIFGPTDPKRTGPYGEIHRVVRGSAKCSPCFKKRCGMPSHLCMEAVSVEMVLEEVLSFLSKSNVGSIGAGREEDG